MANVRRIVRNRILTQLMGVLGFFIWLNIFARRKGKVVVFIGGLGVGDTCVQATYLKSWQQRLASDMLIVCHAPCADVIRKMGYGQEVLGLSKKQVMRACSCYKSVFGGYLDYQSKRGRLIITDPWFYLNKWAAQYVENLTALNVVRDAALQLYDCADCVQVTPSVDTDYETAAGRLQIKEPFVILNPYSNSMNLDLKPFIAIAKALSQAGIHVYCNVVGSQEPVESSLPLKCSVDEFYALSGGAEAVVSIRSGILDYCISNIKRVFCLYDGWVFYRLYTLRAWNTDAEIYERRYEGDKNAASIVEEITGKILDNLP